MFYLTNWDETPASFGQTKLLQVVDSMSRELARLKDSKTGWDGSLGLLMGGF